MTSTLSWVVLALALAGAACAEKPQVQPAGKSEGAAFAGTSGPYNAPGWKPGDQASWEEQMRSRAQYGQNEYSRSSGQ